MLQFADPASMFAEAVDETAYDAVAYPTSIFAQTVPDRMATLARLNGLDPPAIATARVLEIAGGDAMNIIALAQAWPEASFVGFDLAPSAIARGREWIANAGLGNIRLEVLDILDAADRIEGEFDYIIAHGIYAWVPGNVRDALMALIGRKLSPGGVAFVSYNALPGCYIRIALRDLLLQGLRGIEGAEHRMAAAKLLLESVADPDNGPRNAFQDALREAARKALTQEPHVLFHDELGEVYEPQALEHVAASAAHNGLRFLTDACAPWMNDGFLPGGVEAEDDIEVQVVWLQQARDYRLSRFFRHMLLVRDTVRPARALDHAALGQLYASTPARQLDPITFELGGEQFEVTDEALSRAMRYLIAHYPERARVDDLVDPSDADAAERRQAIFDLFNARYVDLHTTAEPFATKATDTPVVSPLAHMMLGAGMSQVCTLDHRIMTVDAPLRELMLRLDGSASVSRMTAEELCGDVTPEALDEALRTLVRSALLQR